MRRVRFSGHDDEGRAVFWDLEYAPDAPTTRDLATGQPSWTSPYAFRLSPAMARYHDGNDYARRGH
jgi:hypothetical protein